MKNLPANADVGSISGSGIPPGVGNGNPQVFLHGAFLDTEAWWAAVHGVTKSDRTKHICTYVYEFLALLSH